MDQASAKEFWEYWDNQADEWWLQHEGPIQHAETTARMLSDVQGYANQLWHMPWRVGRVPQHLRLYTSDNSLQTSSDACDVSTGVMLHGEPLNRANVLSTSR